MRRFLFLVVVFVGSIFLLNCGGGGGGISGTPDQPVGPISIDIGESAVSVQTGDTVQFHYSVQNSANTSCTWKVNDVTGGDVTLGTISISGLYTAPSAVPSPNQVTVKAVAAADATKSDTATVTISPQFAISPSTATLSTGQTQQFTANYPVDVWQVNNVLWGDNAHGTITTGGLYTAPLAVPTPNTVTVTAFMQGNGSKSASATVTLTGQQAVVISPSSPLTIAAGATKQFTANVPVDWSVGTNAQGVSSTTLGTIDSNGLYAAPLSPPWTGQVVIIAMDKANSSNYATVNASIVFSNASLQGHYVLRYRGAYNGQSLQNYTPIWMVGSFVADGNGSITSGSVDICAGSCLTQTATTSITGTYSIGADGRGTGNLILQQLADTPSIPLRWVTLSNTAARMIGFDDTGSGWGTIDQQDTSALANGLSGTYVYSYDGHIGAIVYEEMGTFTISGGTVTSGHFDHHDNTSSGGWSANLFGGGVSINPTTGRGVLTLSEYSYWQYPVYQISSSSFVLMDVLNGGMGQGVQQDRSITYSNSSLSGELVFISTGYANAAPAAAAGRFTADGNGNLSNGVLDNIDGGSGAVNAPASGTYSISPDGRGTMNIQASGGNNAVLIYMTGANQCFYLAQNVLATGQFMPQAAGPYSTVAVHGSVALVLRETYTAPATDTSAQLTADGAGHLTGKADINAAGLLNPDASVTGSYTILSNGRGQVALTMGSSTTNYAIYLISTRAGYLVPIDSGDATAFGILYRQY